MKVIEKFLNLFIEKVLRKKFNRGDRLFWKTQSDHNLKIWKKFNLNLIVCGKAFWLVSLKLFTLCFKTNPKQFSAKKHGNK